MNTLLRIASSIVLLPIVIGSLIMGSYYMATLLAVISFFSIYETAAMVFKKKGYVSLSLAVIGTLMCISSMLGHGEIFIASVAAVGVAFGAHFVFHPNLTNEYYEKMSSFILFSIYACVGVITIYKIRDNQYSFANSTGIYFALLTMVATWSNDTFAYFAGKFFGAHKMIPWVSAKKTWEGFVGGAIGSIAVPIVLRQASVINVTIVDVLFISIPCICLAPIGDLIESKFKRIYGVKDSGNVIPGHGGVLDRIDALLVVAPWTFAYLSFVRPLL